MTTEGKNLLNRVILCEQNRGRIKYVGPIIGVNNDSGKNRWPKIIQSSKLLRVYLRNMVWNRLA